MRFTRATPRTATAGTADEPGRSRYLSCSPPMLAIALALPGFAHDGGGSRHPTQRIDDAVPVGRPSSRRSRSKPWPRSTLRTAPRSATTSPSIELGLFYDAVHQADLDAAAAAARRPAIRPRCIAAGRCGGDVECFLACTRTHESDPPATTEPWPAAGRYRGAYQFDQQTWDTNAAASGRTDLVGAGPGRRTPVRPGPGRLGHLRPPRNPALGRSLLSR